MHIIASDLDVKDHCHDDVVVDENPWMMPNPRTHNRDLLLYNMYNASTIAKAQMLNKPYIHYIGVKIMNNVSRKPLD